MNSEAAEQWPYLLIYNAIHGWGRDFE